jgi:tellurite resistance protein
VSAVGVATGTGRRRRPTIAPNLFSVPFGLTGLADAWRAAEKVLGLPPAVPDGFFILAAAVWFVVLVAYVAQGPARVVADLSDQVLAPFVSLPAIIGMTLAAALASVAFGAGRVLVVVFLALSVALGGWFCGQWVLLDLDSVRFHPGYFLPTVAGGAVGAVAAAGVNLHGAAEASFGLGLISWLLLSATVLNRLYFHPALPAPLIPTLAIEVAPPAVTGAAYFAISQGAVNAIAYAFGGYAILMVVMQLRLVPLYLRQKFSVGTWAFTFSYSITAVLHWSGSPSLRSPTAQAMPRCCSR